VEDNIHFWKGLTSSKLKHEEIFNLLRKLDIEKYYKTKVMYLSSGEIPLDISKPTHPSPSR